MRFDGIAQNERTFEEPVDGFNPVVFPIYRREGTIGRLRVSGRYGRLGDWKLASCVSEIIISFLMS